MLVYMRRYLAKEATIGETMARKSALFMAMECVMQSNCTVCNPSESPYPRITERYFSWPVQV